MTGEINELACGNFRGENGLVANVRFGTEFGAPSDSVPGEMQAWHLRASAMLEQIDSLLEKDQLWRRSADAVDQVAVAIAEIKSEFVRIHPFTEGNGRMSRLISSLIAYRYGFALFEKPGEHPPDPYVARMNQGMHGELDELVDYIADLLVMLPDDDWPPSS